MTNRQRLLKIFYPVLMVVNRLTGKKNKIMSNKENAMPSASIYDLAVKLNNGKELKLADLKGKKILLVNTASNCGYTNQYADLQSISEKYRDRLVVIGFPANDFADQETGSDDEIAAFCQVNFGVNFPLAKKSSVIKGNEQNSVFRWLSDKRLNGWNDQEPTWNFSKYLVNEEGQLLNYFGAAVSPSGSEILGTVTQQAS
jgi:glutathione peroxidase